MKNETRKFVKDRLGYPHKFNVYLIGYENSASCMLIFPVSSTNLIPLFLFASTFECLSKIEIIREAADIAF